MLVFGFGVSTDVNNLSFAVLDHDQTPESRAYLEELRGSTYFVEKPPLADYGELENRLRSGSIKAAIEIPPDFGRDIKRGRPAWVGAWVDGAMPFRAETIRGYLQAMHAAVPDGPGREDDRACCAAARRYRTEVQIQSGLRLHLCDGACQTMALMLGLFPAILMALGVVREKELGSITNLYVTPVTRFEFLMGKQLPYVAVAVANFALLFLMALFIFQVPLKGSFPALVLGVLLYVTAMTAYGMLISALHEHPNRRAVRHSHSDRAACDAIRRNDDAGFVPGRLRPDRWPRVPDDLFRARSASERSPKVWAFSTSAASLAALAVFIPMLTLMNVLLLRKQER